MRRCCARATAERGAGDWNDAREHWLDLRARRLDGMAAELAAGLADGADCPVCGAVEHPRPAAHVGPVVTAADEQAAREAADRARRSGRRRRRRRAPERELAGLRAQAGPCRSTSSWPR